MSELAVALSGCLADVTVMYHRTHAFHWNVVGTDFPQYHAKFEEIYTDVYESIDPLAENIRKVGKFVPFRLQDLSAMASTPDNPVSGYHHDDLVKDLLVTNTEVIRSLKAAFQIADSENEQGIANFLADRIDSHQKWQWQLTACLQG